MRSPVLNVVVQASWPWARKYFKIRRCRRIGEAGIASTGMAEPVQLTPSTLLSMYSLGLAKAAVLIPQAIARGPQGYRANPIHQTLVLLPVDQGVAGRLKQRLPRHQSHLRWALTWAI